MQNAPTSITPYPAIDLLLNELCEQIHQALDDKLVGLYLYGSLVTGDFDQANSDIDLLAVLASELTEKEFAHLDGLHYAFVAAHPLWEDRIEIAYLTHAALKTFRTQASPIAIISPGEPFHFKEAGNDWLINWWIVRRQGTALYGPPAADVIDPIGDDEFQAAVRRQVYDWRDYVHGMERRKSQAYAILTLCRALYAWHNGEQVSKRRAAEWAADSFPQWATQIRDAWQWRLAPDEDGVDHAATHAATVQFAQAVAAHMGV
jgi:hypothetical protein